MSQVGESSNTLNEYPRLRACAQATARNGTIVTTTVLGTIANGASSMAAKQLADYYEWVAESGIGTEFTV